jgi:uncharacterized protein
MTKMSAFDPMQPDITSLCQRGSSVAGEFSADRFLRLLADQVRPLGAVTWQLSGGVIPRHERPDYAGKTFLSLEWQASLSLPCARCLQSMNAELKGQQRYVLFDTEQEADAAPMEDDDYDALVKQTPFDLLGLIEDEILLALDPAPRHEVCPTGALAQSITERAGTEPETHRPFEALRKTWAPTKK